MGDRPRRQPVGARMRDSRSGDLEQSLDLDGGVERQRRRRRWSCGRAGPCRRTPSTIRSEAPFITLGPSRKSGAELMKPPSRTHALDLVEIAERGFDLRQQIDGASARRLLAVLDRDAGAELALGDELAVGTEADLAGDHEQIARCARSRT